jgi:opacity protein-like surface antigen
VNTKLKTALPVLLVVVFVVTGAAYAQPYYPPASPLYFGVFGGWVIPQSMNWKSNTSSNTADLTLDNSGMLGLKLGYILPQARALAVEFEWNYMFQQNIPTQVTPNGVTESGNVSLNNFLFNLILRYPEGKFHPYIGGGIGGSSMNIQNTESDQNHVHVANETSTGFAWQLLAGINFDLAPNLSADLTYRYLGTNPSFTAINVDYRTSAVTVGLNFHF